MKPKSYDIPYFLYGFHANNEILELILNPIKEKTRIFTDADDANKAKAEAEENIRPPIERYIATASGYKLHFPDLGMGFSRNGSVTGILTFISQEELDILDDFFKNMDTKDETDIFKPKHRIEVKYHNDDVITLIAITHLRKELTFIGDFFYQTKNPNHDIYDILSKSLDNLNYQSVKTDNLVKDFKNNYFVNSEINIREILFGNDILLSKEIVSYKKEELEVPNRETLLKTNFNLDKNQKKIIVIENAHDLDSEYGPPSFTNFKGFFLIKGYDKLQELISSYKIKGLEYYDINLEVLSISNPYNEVDYASHKIKDLIREIKFSNIAEFEYDREYGNWEKYKDSFAFWASDENEFLWDSRNSPGEMGEIIPYDEYYLPKEDEYIYGGQLADSYCIDEDENYNPDNNYKRRICLIKFDENLINPEYIELIYKYSSKSALGYPDQKAGTKIYNFSLIRSTIQSYLIKILKETRTDLHTDIKVMLPEISVQADVVKLVKDGNKKVSNITNIMQIVMKKPTENYLLLKNSDKSSEYFSNFQMMNEILVKGETIQVEFKESLAYNNITKKNGQFTPFRCNTSIKFS